jgi:hypothetical protein
MTDHELPSWTATLSDLHDAMIEAAQNGRVTWLTCKGDRTAAIVPPDGWSDAGKLRGAAAVLRKHAKRKTIIGGVFVRVLERHADRLERG